MSDETRENNSAYTFQWTTTDLNNVEGYVWEPTRAIGVIGAIFAGTLLLRIHRFFAKPNAAGLA